ncbi:MAG TPA: HSP20 family small heat-shock protein [Kofleriaceae bacterium]|jgi:HSP20 family protein|nr:HSP20 family small heat-shock protein [Kofleriaceae bacterium]
MANPKTDGNQPTQQPAAQPPAAQPPTTQSQSVPVRTGQPQAQRGELVRRDPLELLARDPLQLLMRDPFQLMRDMLVEPFRALGAWPTREAAWNPSFEIRETDDAFVFRADVPGLRPDELDISVIGNQLQISGAREQDQQQDEGRYHTYERAYGSFTRVFALPDSADIDNLRAELNHGVLTLSVPKKAGTSPQRRKIQIGSGAGSKS